MFKQGQEIISVYWSEGEPITGGKNGCIKISIDMVNGQMAGVPWAKATFVDGKVRGYNLALVEGVQLE